MPNEVRSNPSDDEPPDAGLVPRGAQRRSASTERFSLPNEDIPVVALRQNVDQVVVRVTHDKLQGHLESYARGIDFKTEIRVAGVEAAASLGLALALGLPLFTATFSDLGPVPAEVLRPTCGVLSLVCLLVAFERVLRAWRSRRAGTTDHTTVGRALEAIENDREFPTST